MSNTGIFIVIGILILIIILFLRRIIIRNFYRARFNIYSKDIILEKDGQVSSSKCYFSEDKDSGKQSECYGNQEDLIKSLGQNG